MKIIDESEKKSTVILRPGKTRRDHRSSAWVRRFANQAARAAWQKGDDAVFPAYTCNGRRYYRGGSDTTSERLARKTL